MANEAFTQEDLDNFFSTEESKVPLGSKSS